MRLSIIILAAFVLLLSGCISYPENKQPSNVAEEEKLSIKEEAVKECIKLCKSAIASGIDLSNGPCLSDNNPEWQIEDWVCDVAHWPRKEVDNLAKNQCNEFREGRAKHFVEVDEECRPIRAI
ncbi:MAG: hypothetical protein J7L14_02820 [Candidatus Diapherotrites archaeon]|nr:hypothetical protein [Candidatus Diapherotrites archaeon]